jgi:hypothetical protein
MNLVYIHIPCEDSRYTSSEFPTFAHYTVRHNYTHHTSSTVIVSPTNPNIEGVEYTWIDVNKYTHKLRELRQVTRVSDSFIFVTFARLYILYYVMKDLELENVIHIENDNLLFYNTGNLESYFDKRNIMYTIIGPVVGSAGFMLIPEASMYKEFCIKCIQLIVKNKSLSDMNVLSILRSDESVCLLPSLPGDVLSDRYIFDGASYGQYLEGNNQGSGPGHISQDHFTAPLLQSRELKVFHDIRELPIVEQSGEQYMLFNLHIHNKSRLLRYDQR